MTTIPGASQFLNSATLANRQGLSAVQPSVLGEAGIGAIDILDIGRINNSTGIGLSASARALNKQQLSASTANFNALFSLGAGPDATIEGAQQQILALRSRLSDDQLAPDLRATDDGSASASDLGQEIDTEA